MKPIPHATRPPEEDETSIGRILIAMGLVTGQQVAYAHQLQQESTEEDRIGMFLVAQGHLTMAELTDALTAQDGLRSRARHKRALAKASIAQVSGSSVMELAGEVRGKSAEARRKSNQHGYPKVSREGPDTR